MVKQVEDRERCERATAEQKAAEEATQRLAATVDNLAGHIRRMEFREAECERSCLTLRSEAESAQAARHRVMQEAESFQDSEARTMNGLRAELQEALTRADETGAHLRVAQGAKCPLCPVYLAEIVQARRAEENEVAEAREKYRNIEAAADMAYSRIQLELGQMNKGLHKLDKKRNPILTD